MSDTELAQFLQLMSDEIKAIRLEAAQDRSEQRQEQADFRNESLVWRAAFKQDLDRFTVFMNEVYALRKMTAYLLAIIGALGAIIKFGFDLGHNLLHKLLVWLLNS